MYLALFPFATGDGCITEDEAEDAPDEDEAEEEELLTSDFSVARLVVYLCRIL